MRRLPLGSGAARSDGAGDCREHVIFTDSIPIGGGHVTNDIATVLRTPLDSAEKIKKKYGCACRGWTASP